jgi:anti-sigma factor RsiW
MEHADARALLHGELDGELDAASALALARHLAGCAACRREQAALAGLRAALRQEGLAHACPPDLAARFRQQWLASEAPAPATGLSGLQPAPRPAPLPETMVVQRPARPRRSRVAVAVLAAAAVVVGWWALVPRAPAPPDPAVVAAVVAGHLRSLLAEHLVDRPSSDQHQVKPWFAGKVDYAPTVIDLANQGFALAGGRLDYLSDRTVAALVYRRRLHVINCFQWPEDGGDSALASATERGFHLLTWRQDACRWWLVSDLNAEELEQLAGDLRRGGSAGNPAH